MDFEIPGIIHERCALMLITAFLDESGKFKDHSVVALAGVAGTPQDCTALSNDWERELHRAGLACLSMKECLNYNVPLSKKRPAKGMQNRLDALMPFITAIRRNARFAFSVAIDTSAFKLLSTDVQKVFAGDPYYVAFIRMVTSILEPLQEGDKLGLVCDDEEQTALPMYRLYRKIRVGWKDARTRLASICFANDEFFAPLQAADMVASLIRMKVRNSLHAESNDYGTLLEALCQPQDSDRMWAFDSVLFNNDALTSLGHKIQIARKKYGPDATLLGTH